MPRQGLRAWVQQGASFSGHERNRLFRQIDRGGELVYEDISLISGADSIQDGRAFVKLDVDWDGDVDFFLANANAPRTEFLRNEHAGDRGGALWIDLEGAARPAVNDASRSNRDAVGARVIVRVDSATEIHRERRAGEGFASQNTDWLHVGLGASTAVKGIEVWWPSGRKTTVEGPIQANQRIRLYESSSDSPTRSSLEVVGPLEPLR